MWCRTRRRAGDLPFSTDAGLTHYYGVGAYRRPLEDARRAEVGFASECLAFANVPDAATLREADLCDPTSPGWAATVPRDRGADWEFEQVRDHYLQDLFGLDPETLRRDDPDRYCALARAASAEVMEAVFAEWRRARSPTGGGLVWFFRDLAPGIGWGVVDAAGRPKSAWYALKRAFRPVQVTISDEGLNGLHLHVHNETAAPLSAVLRLVFSDAEGRAVARGERAVAVAPRGSATWSSATLLGRFFDATGSYRFGPWCTPSPMRAWSMRTPTPSSPRASTSRKGAIPRRARLASPPRSNRVLPVPSSGSRRTATRSACASRPRRAPGPPTTASTSPPACPAASPSSAAGIRTGSFAP